MTGRPILFSGPMVRALLDGRKTQTRRVLKPQPYFNHGGPILDAAGGHMDYIEPHWSPEPRHPYAPGGRLWVRETWQVVRETLDYETGGEFDVFAWDRDYGDPRNHLNGDARAGTKTGIYYAADGEDQNPCNFYPVVGIDGKVLREREIAWRPSIHMPRWASRLTLIVTDVRVQRLQDISEEDAIAEGCPGVLGPNPDFPDEWDPSPTEEFRELWNSLNAERGHGWDANPWVVALTFTAHRRNIDQMETEA